MSEPLPQQSPAPTGAPPPGGADTSIKPHERIQIKGGEFRPRFPSTSTASQHESPLIPAPGACSVTSMVGAIDPAPPPSAGRALAASLRRIIGLLALGAAAAGNGIMRFLQRRGPRARANEGTPPGAGLLRGPR